MAIKGVIVAAGLGLRLMPYTKNCPKPMLLVGGRPLIDYTIEAFARAGIKELGIVLGGNGDRLRRHLWRNGNHGLSVVCLSNGLCHRGNATSILAAQAFIGQEPFVASVADHLIAPQILAPLLSRCFDAHVLCIDFGTRTGPALEDATKVCLDRRHRVKRIGKGLTSWDALDCGVFLFQPRVFRYIQELLDHAHGQCTITNLVRHILASGDQVHTVNISGAFWLDVDTPADLARARTLFAPRVQTLQLAPVP